MIEDNNNILAKLDGLESRYEEVSTLITDPAVIADQERYVKLTREYKDLGDIMDARKRYVACLNSIAEAKDILANEIDPDMKEMAGPGRILVSRLAGMPAGEMVIIRPPGATARRRDRRFFPVVSSTAR